MTAMKKETIAIRFLYRTYIGRCMLKIMIRPQFSNVAYRYLNSRFSKWLIRYYIRKHHIDMRPYEKKRYRSFNDFFTRKKKKRKKSLWVSSDLISPCDGYLSVYRLDGACNIRIKNVVYSAAGLLHNAVLAGAYQDGYCLVFRLAPHNYHRYLYIDNGTVERYVKIPGVLHCVRPVACECFPVYVQNSREYTKIRTEHLGEIIQMEIGALLVGRIHNHNRGRQVYKGQEKGYFEFGGSTIVLLVEKGKVCFNHDLSQNIGTGKEIAVTAGEIIGSCGQSQKGTGQL